MDTIDDGGMMIRFFFPCLHPCFCCVGWWVAGGGGSGAWAVALSYDI